MISPLICSLNNFNSSTDWIKVAALFGLPVSRRYRNRRRPGKCCSFSAIVIQSSSYLTVDWSVNGTLVPSGHLTAAGILNTYEGLSTLIALWIELGLTTGFRVVLQ